jgi:hypothetical protein
MGNQVNKYTCHLIVETKDLHVDKGKKADPSIEGDRCQQIFHSRRYPVTAIGFET